MKTISRSGTVNLLADGDRPEIIAWSGSTSWVIGFADRKDGPSCLARNGRQEWCREGMLVRVVNPPGRRNP
jgi:hypothetical protein